MAYSCRRRIYAIDNGGDGGAVVWGDERNLSPVGQIIPPWQGLETPGGGNICICLFSTKILSYVSYVLFSYMLHSLSYVSMEGQPDLTLLSRQMPRLSFVYPPSHHHPPSPLSVVCGRACYYGFFIVYTCQQVLICQILKTFPWI